MCGINGQILGRPLSREDIANTMLARDTLQHRGPDDKGIWVDCKHGIVMGHRRLAVVDLSPSGSQPMKSESGRYILSFNGEIYNYKDLQLKLEQERVAPAWSGSSDTEILLAAIDAWGLRETCLALRGMFAIALWDREEQRLSLARDAIGEKPLYVGKVAGGFAFASELKGLTCLPCFSRERDTESFGLSLKHGFIPGPKTIFKSAIKLQPGMILSIDRQQCDKDIFDLQQTAFFDIITEAQSAKSNPFAGSFSDATAELNRLLENSVDRTMVADVPVGCFLSGGIDSATVVAIMQSRTSKPVQTFTMGFDDKKLDESPHAQAVAQHLGTDHHELRIAPDDAMDWLERMPSTYDEPFCDPSKLPTAMLSEFARKHVTVSLSGDGGDELFGGYRRYNRFIKRWSGPGGQSSMMETVATKWAKSMLQLPGLSQATGSLNRYKLISFISRLSHETLGAAYSEKFVQIELADQLLKPELEINSYLNLDRIIQTARNNSWTALDQLSLMDIIQYLPDDILTKVDRSSMLSSLESRAPLLDMDILRFSLSLPDDFKREGNEGKQILKSVLALYLPEKLWRRPKRGFGIPTGTWLRGPLKPLVEDTLYTAKKTIDFLDHRLIEGIWHLFQKERFPADPMWTLFCTLYYETRCD